MYRKRPKVQLGLLHAIFATSKMFSIPVQSSDVPEIQRIPEQSANVVIDGLLDESVWQRIPAFDGMRKIDPDTLENVPYETDIRFLPRKEAFILAYLIISQLTH